jgi:hypothetical protein
MVTFTCIGGHNQGKIPQNHHVRRNIMKKFSIIAMVFMLTASLLTGCRRPDAGTTGGTDNNPSSSSSVVRPEPTITMPDPSDSQPSGSGAGNGAGAQGRMGGMS